MRQRSAGRSDLRLSEIGFGTGGNAGLMVRGTQSEQDHTIASALERGITYFDTSPDYGDGDAERNLGRSLRACNAGNAVITTKVEIRAENLGDIGGWVERSLEASLRRLQCDHVDVLQIHNGPTARTIKLEGRDYRRLPLDDYLRAGGALDGLNRVVSAGKARHAGFVCRGDDSAEITKVLSTRPFALVNLPYTLLNPSAALSEEEGRAFTPNFANAIGIASSFDAGIAVFSPLAGGLLTAAMLAGDGPHALSRPKNMQSAEIERSMRQARSFSEVARRFGVSLIELAYRFILQTPGVTTVVAGFSSPDQVRQIADIAAEPLEAEVVAALRETWRAQPVSA